MKRQGESKSQNQQNTSTSGIVSGLLAIDFDQTVTGEAVHLYKELKKFFSSLYIQSLISKTEIDKDFNSFKQNKETQELVTRIGQLQSEIGSLRDDNKNEEADELESSLQQINQDLKNKFYQYLEEKSPKNAKEIDNFMELIESGNIFHGSGLWRTCGVEALIKVLTDANEGIGSLGCEFPSDEISENDFTQLMSSILTNRQELVESYFTKHPSLSQKEKLAIAYTFKLSQEKRDFFMGVKEFKKLLEEAKEKNYEAVIVTKNTFKSAVEFVMSELLRQKLPILSCPDGKSPDDVNRLNQIKEAAALITKCSFIKLKTVLIDDDYTVLQQISRSEGELEHCKGFFPAYTRSEQKLPYNDAIEYFKSLPKDNSIQIQLDWKKLSEKLSGNHNEKNEEIYNFAKFIELAQNQGQTVQIDLNKETSMQVFEGLKGFLEGFAMRHKDLNNIKVFFDETFNQHFKEDDSHLKQASSGEKEPLGPPVDVDDDLPTQSLSATEVLKDTELSGQGSAEHD